MATSTPATRIDKPAAIFAVVLLIALCGVIYLDYSIKQVLLVLTGAGLGLSLFHARFGFTGSWRVFIRERKGEGVRAQLILLAVTSILFFPILGQLFGIQNVNAALAPVGVAVLIGAFIFGIGMQLGGGCGSGTLYTVGQGQVDMLFTLVFFIIGATFGSAHLSWWLTLPNIGEQSLIQFAGWFPALLINLVLIGVLFFIVRKIERTTAVTSPARLNSRLAILIHGHWPWAWGVIGLALLNLVTLLLAGHPWTITYAFGLWGAKFWAAIGGDPQSWTYWSSGYPAQSLNTSVLADTTSLMDFGLILGALLAAALADKVAPAMKLSGKRIITAIVGGLLMGYGARLSFGCNIGALLAGITTGSVHGWLWLVSAFAGGILGVHTRVWMKIDKPMETHT